jgi:hypothetical protein
VQCCGVIEGDVPNVTYLKWIEVFGLWHNETWSDQLFKAIKFDGDILFELTFVYKQMDVSKQMQGMEKR